MCLLRCGRITGSWWGRAGGDWVGVDKFLQWLKPANRSAVAVKPRLNNVKVPFVQNRAAPSRDDFFWWAAN